MMNEPEPKPPSEYETCGTHTPATPPMPPGVHARIRVTANFATVKGFEASSRLEDLLSTDPTSSDAQTEAGPLLRPPPCS